MKTLFSLAVAGILALAGSASAAPINLVTNGDFSQTTYTKNQEFGERWGGQGVTGWTGNDGLVLFYFGGTATTQAAATLGAPFGKVNPLNVLSGVAGSTTGGNLVALDGDVKVRGGISQMIENLIIGHEYTLTFEWGASQMKTEKGATTEKLEVSFGDETYTTQTLSNKTHSFTGWVTETFTFTAKDTSALLDFLSVGTPSGLPPIAVLSNISLYDTTEEQAVPEPATLALLTVASGALLLGIARRRRQGLAE